MGLIYEHCCFLLKTYNVPEHHWATDNLTAKSFNALAIALINTILLVHMCDGTRKSTRRSTGSTSFETKQSLHRETSLQLQLWIPQINAVQYIRRSHGSGTHMTEMSIANEEHVRERHTCCLHSHTCAVSSMHVKAPSARLHATTDCTLWRWICCSKNNACISVYTAYRNGETFQRIHQA